METNRRAASASIGKGYMSEIPMDGVVSNMTEVEPKEFQLSLGKRLEFVALYYLGTPLMFSMLSICLIIVSEFTNRAKSLHLVVIILLVVLFMFSTYTFFFNLIVCARESFFGTKYRVTSQGIVKIWPTGRRVHMCWSDLSAVKGGINEWPSIRNFYLGVGPTILEFKSGTRMLIAPNGVQSLRLYMPLLVFVAAIDVPENVVTRALENMKSREQYHSRIHGWRIYLYLLVPIWSIFAVLLQGMIFRYETELVPEYVAWFSAISIVVLLGAYVYRSRFMDSGDRKNIDKKQ